MKILLQFLIYRMKTLDGNKNSAVQILEALNKQTIREYLKQTGRKIVTASKEHQIRSMNEYKVFRKIQLKYTIMKVRSKLSFQALLFRVPLVEMLFNAIFKSYRQLVSDKYIPGYSRDVEYQHNEIYNAICRGDISCLKQMIMLNSANIESDTLQENLEKDQEE